MFTVAAYAFGEQVDFYATVSDSGDSNMVSMITDLYLSQMQTISGYTVQDKRGTSYDAKTASDSNISFWAQILETESGEWSCTLNAVKASTGKSLSLTKTYSSYYLILMDSKDSLENLLSNISSSNDDLPQVKSAAGGTNLESLSGNWAGGSSIDKVVIMKGGRGFVIYKNGASMNIAIEMKGTKIIVTQQGKSNASFYPSLSREVAMQNAMTAQPTVWELTIIDADTLRGTETTLIADASSPSGASRGTVSAEWIRK